MHYSNDSTKLHLVLTLLLPHFDYCDAVYRPILSVNNMRAIQSVQNAALRFVYGFKKSEHVLYYLNNANLLNMSRRRCLRLCCLLHKIIMNKSPDYLFNKLITRSSYYSYSTRNSNSLNVPRCRLSLTAGAFSVSAARAWNSMPKQIAQCNTLNKLKSKLTEYLLQKQKSTNNTYDSG